mgnify:CR=1 FL=1
MPLLRQLFSLLPFVLTLFLALLLTLSHGPSHAKLHFGEEQTGHLLWLTLLGLAAEVEVGGEPTPMLIEPGAAAFEHWFGVAADRQAMWKAAGAAGSAGPASSITTMRGTGRRLR